MQAVCHCLLGDANFKGQVELSILVSSIVRTVSTSQCHREFVLTRCYGSRFFTRGFIVQLRSIVVTRLQSGSNAL